MLAGFHKVDITPPLSEMDVFGLGYWFERAVRFHGVRDPLYARAVAMGDGPACQILISVDAIFDSFGFIEEATRHIAVKLGIASANIFATCTHTHSTPLIHRNNTERGAEYGAYVAERLVTAAAEAFRKREPANVSVCRGPVDNVLYNRRVLLKNGRIAELHVPVDPEAIADSGPVDETLTLVKFRNGKGALIGALCHFGIHGVAVQCSDLISSDCMGRAIQEAESQLGNAAVILHLNAPCADIDPVAMGDLAALDTMTGRLSLGIEQVSRSEERAVLTIPQRSVSRCFRARRRATRPAELMREEERRAVGEAQSENLRHHSGRGYELFLLMEERAVAEMPEEFEIPYQILQAGDLVWVGIGGEIFTSFGTRLKSRFPESVLLITGITGGSQGYLPPEAAFSQGGYEVACARWCPIAPGETEKLFARMERDLESALTAEAR